MPPKNKKGGKAGSQSPPKTMTTDDIQKGTNKGSNSSPSDDSKSILLDNKVGVSTLPGDQMGAFEAQVEARMMSVGSDILVSKEV